MKPFFRLLAPLLLSVCVLLSGCSASSEPVVSLDAIPAYSGDPYVVINGNVPFFEDSDFTTTAYEDH